MSKCPNCLLPIWTRAVCAQWCSWRTGRPGWRLCLGSRWAPCWGGWGTIAGSSQLDWSWNTLFPGECWWPFCFRPPCSRCFATPAPRFWAHPWTPESTNWSTTLRSSFFCRPPCRKFGTIRLTHTLKSEFKFCSSSRLRFFGLWNRIFAKLKC